MPLFYFIAGILFIYFIVPLVEGLSGLILTWLERLKSKEAAEIYKIKQSLTDDEGPSRAIGFVYEEEEEEE